MKKTMAESEAAAPAALASDETASEQAVGATSGHLASPPLPKRQRLSTSDLMKAKVGSSPSGGTDASKDLIEAVCLEFQVIKKKGFDEAAGFLSKNTGGGPLDPSILKDKVIGKVEQAPTAATYADMHEKMRALADSYGNIDELDEVDTAMLKLTNQTPPIDAGKTPNVAPLYGSTTLSPGLCLEAGYSLTRRLVQREGRFALEFGDSKNTHSILGGFMSGEQEYNNTRAGLFSQEEQNNSVFYIGGSDLKIFFDSFESVRKLFDELNTWLLAKGLDVVAHGARKQKKNSIVLAGVNLLFHGALNSQWNWHQDTYEFNYKSYLSVVVQLSGGVSQAQVFDLSKVGEEEWVKTVDYRGPGAMLALRSDLFHRTLSAERRTVKLVFFFRLPVSMKAAIEVDHVDPKNTLVGEKEKKVKVKVEKKEQSSSTEGTTSGTTPVDGSPAAKKKQLAVIDGGKK